MHLRHNEHTGASFSHLPRPKSCKIWALKPQWIGWRRALEQVLTLIKAFREYSTEFRVALIDICPVLGDCKIIHQPTAATLVIEIKAWHYKIVHDLATGADVLSHDPFQLGMNNHPIFNTRSLWDYLYTTQLSYDHPNDRDGIESDGEEGFGGGDRHERENVTEAFLIPRDAIPTEWWTRPADDTTRLQWRSDATVGFRQFAVDATTRLHLIRDIEQILKTWERDSGSMKAQILPPPRQPSTGQEMGMDEDAVGGDPDLVISEEHSLIHKQPWFPHVYELGQGSALHGTLRGNTYEVWASEILLELCRVW